MRRCEKCPNETRARDDRYCRPCAKLVLKELKADGYLKPISDPSEYHGSGWHDDVSFARRLSDGSHLLSGGSMDDIPRGY